MKMARSILFSPTGASSNSRRGRGRSLHGFTLIELLVVIAILALLVSILVPSLRQAQDLAKTVVCASNMRGLAQATAFYATERGGYLPRAATHYDSLTFAGITRTDVWVPWYSNLYIGEFFDNERVGASAFPPKQQGSGSEIAYCPSFKRTVNEMATGIGYNYVWNCAFTDEKGGPTLFSDFDVPQKVILFADSYSSYTLDRVNHVPSEWGKDPMYRHQNKLNVALADGHVESSDDLEADCDDDVFTVRANSKSN